MNIENKKGFNLLRPQMIPEEKWDKIYNWMNKTARFVVIVVELIVIVCFGARVVVDSIARDLEEQLEVNDQRLENLLDAEEEIRQIQRDTETYRGMWNNASGFSVPLEEVYSLDRPLLSTLTINVTEDGVVNLSGEAKRGDIDELETNLKESDSFYFTETVSLRSEGQSDDSLAKFQLKPQIYQFTRDLISSPISTENGN